MWRRVPRSTDRSSPASSLSSEMTSSSRRRRSWTASTRKTTPGLLAFSKRLPLLVEVPLEVEVPHAGPGDELRLQLRRVRIEATAGVGHLVRQHYRRIIQRDEIDLAAGFPGSVGLQVEQLIE